MCYFHNVMKYINTHWWLVLLIPYFKAWLNANKVNEEILNNCKTMHVCTQRPPKSGNGIMGTLECQDCMKHNYSTYHKDGECRETFPLTWVPRQLWLWLLKQEDLRYQTETPILFSRGWERLTTVKDFYSVTSRTWTLNNRSCNCANYHCASQRQ